MIAPQTRPSRETLIKSTKFLAKPSRKPLINFGKPSRSLIIQTFRFPDYKSHTFHRISVNVKECVFIKLQCYKYIFVSLLSFIIFSVHMVPYGRVTIFHRTPIPMNRSQVLPHN